MERPAQGTGTEPIVSAHFRSLLYTNWDERIAFLAAHARVDTMINDATASRAPRFQGPGTKQSFIVINTVVSHITAKIQENNAVM